LIISYIISDDTACLQQREFPVALVRGSGAWKGTERDGSGKEGKGRMN